MVQTPDDATKRMAGFELRLPKCQWTRIQRQGQDRPELRPTPQCVNLQERRETPVGSCMRVVGAHVQPVGGHHAEFKEAGRVAWAAFHAKKSLWNAPGQLLSRVRVLQCTVFARLFWTAGTRHWTAAEIARNSSPLDRDGKKVGQMVVMRHRSMVRLWPTHQSLGGGQPGYLNGTGRELPLGGVGPARHLGRLGHREPWRWGAIAAAWTDGWWRYTIRGL